MFKVATFWAWDVACGQALRKGGSGMCNATVAFPCLRRHSAITPAVWLHMLAQAQGPYAGLCPLASVD